MLLLFRLIAIHFVGDTHGNGENQEKNEHNFFHVN
jgi:hypothetical protein